MRRVIKMLNEDDRRFLLVMTDVSLAMFAAALVVCSLQFIVGVFD